MKLFTIAPLVLQTSAQTTNVVECVDKFEHCVQMTMGNGCEHNAYARENCPKSCGQVCHEDTSCVNQKDSCDQWAAEGRCNADWSKDTMKWKCPKSCGYTECPAPPEPNVECTDLNAHCEEMAQGGQCTYDPVYMNDKCKRSCGQECGPAIPFPNEKCTDDFDHCEDMAQQGLCGTNTWMQDACKRSCGLDCPEQQSCKDFYELCDTWKAEGKCTMHSTSYQMKWRCPATCGHVCPEPPTPNPECWNVGDDELCEMRARNGFCIFEPDMMEANCKKSCGLTDCRTSGVAPTPPTPNLECTDAFDHCVPMAAGGQCDTNPWMANNCKRSCGLECPGEELPTPNLQCRDDYEHCADLAADGQCAVNPWMADNCKRSCGLDCPELQWCVDTSDECETWAAEGQCESHPTMMRWQCGFQCGKTDCEEPPAINEKCPDSADSLPFCRAMAIGGECTRDPDYMRDHCPKACGFSNCEPLEPITTCEDQDPECAEMAANGACEHSSHLMAWKCGAQCGKTNCFTPPAINEECPEETDVMPFCRQMALGGECSRDPMYMWDHCRRSCGFDCSTSPPIPTVGCTDDHEWCLEKALRGECARSPQYMLNQCQRSCGISCGLPCGCDHEELAARYIVNQNGNNGRAVCSRNGKKADGRGSAWILYCKNDTNWSPNQDEVHTYITMRAKCAPSHILSCEPDAPTCPHLRQAIFAQSTKTPGTTFKCIGEDPNNAGQYTYQCTSANGYQSRLTTNKKGLINRWAKKEMCNGGPTCGCDAEASQLKRVACVSNNQFTCDLAAGGHKTFKVPPNACSRLLKRKCALK